MTAVPIASLIVADDPEDRDPADYSPLTDGLSTAQQALIMDAVDIFGAQQVAVSRPAADGSVVLQVPTGKLHTTAHLTRVDRDGQMMGASALIDRPRA